jgi:hypothetical protein
LNAKHLLEICFPHELVHSAVVNHSRQLSSPKLRALPLHDGVHRILQRVRNGLKHARFFEEIVDPIGIIAVSRAAVLIIIAAAKFLSSKSADRLGMSLDKMEP